MPLKIAVQMDPIESINPAADSTFALMLEAQSRGHAVDYYTPDSLTLSDNRVSALVALIAVVVVFTLLLNAGPPTEWGR